MGAFCLIRYYHLMTDNQEVSLIWIIFYNKAVSAFFDNHIVIKQVLLDFFDNLIVLLMKIHIDECIWRR